MASALPILHNAELLANDYNSTCVCLPHSSDSHFSSTTSSPSPKSFMATKWHWEPRNKSI